MPKNAPDLTLLILISILIIWGMFTLATVSFHFSLERYGNSWHYFLHQLLMGFLPGILLVFIILKLNLEKFKKISFYLFGINLILLILVFLPKIGVEIQGARRWLSIGPVLFQPSEFLKITFLLYLASWLSGKLKNKEKTKKKSKGIGWQAPFVFIIMLGILGLILNWQPDLSTLIIIFLASLSVYFVSATPWWHSIPIVLGSGGIVALLIKFEPYRLYRVLPVLNPQIDPMGIGYQLKQCLISIGSGRLFGIGKGFSIGLSQQKFNFLPQPMTDSIFAIIGEELGFLGCSLLVLLFLLFAWQGLKIGLNSRNEFFKLLAVGITSWLTFQAFFNIGGIIGILPLAGIPLPFFSYGSSHLLTEMIAIGLLLNISKKT